MLQSLHSLHALVASKALPHHISPSWEQPGMLQPPQVPQTPVKHASNKGCDATNRPGKQTVRLINSSPVDSGLQNEALKGRKEGEVFFLPRSSCEAPVKVHRQC